MKDQPVTIDINLVPKDPFFATTLGRTLQWALSAGRYIVMFTELIVVLSFVTRFYLDRQVTDLNQRILVQQNTIESYGTFEQEFRDVQQKIEQYQQIEQTENIVDVFPALSQVIPSGVELQELAIYPDKVAISGVVLSQRSLNLLINNLQLSPNFTNVVVNTIESTGTTVNSGFAFRLNAQVNGSE
jgi:Tfp pilus assembly protein PilN